MRTFEVGSEAEGCVADDDTGALFVWEEDVGLWRYAAEPTGGRPESPSIVSSPPAATSRRCRGRHARHLPGGAGYVITSAQNVSNPNNSYFAVYRRAAPHEFVKTFRVTDGTRSDDCDRTDGVTVTTASLGPNFPSGMFVCQDNNNDAREHRATRASSSCPCSGWSTSTTARRLRPGPRGSERVDDHAMSTPTRWRRIPSTTA